MVHKREMVGGRTVERVWWRRKGHQGDKWKFGRVTIPASGAKYYQVVLEAKVGRGRGGIIAVDDISLDVSQPCRDVLENGGMHKLTINQCKMLISLIPTNHTYTLL
jgi:hypothetical protein